MVRTNTKKAVILINIGSPSSYKTKDVRRYLREFLSDKHVINVNPILRFILVNLIIAPFRAKKSAQKYKEIWTEDGSPLIVHTKHLAEKLQKIYKDEADVFPAMRYGKDSIKEILDNINKKNYSDLIVIPLYPHYSSSTTGSSIEAVFNEIKKQENIPQINIINSFWNHPEYIHALAENIKASMPETYDHIVFSYHGLPLKQVYAAHQGLNCTELNCIDQINEQNSFCYQATCYQTTNLIIDKLKLSEENISTSFQSRLSKDWLSPFTDDTLIRLANEEKKKVLIICPSFVADCLETLHEIEIEYAEIFKENGGDSLTLVPALNSEDHWVNSLNLILDNSESAHLI